MLKGKPQAQNGITCSKACDTKSRFTTWLKCSFNLPQKCNLNQPDWNFLVNPEKIIICHVGPLVLAPRGRQGKICKIKLMPFLFLPKISRSLNTRLSFLLRISSLAPPISYKNLPFYLPPWEHLTMARWDAAQFMTHLKKPIRSPNVHCWILVF